MDALHSNKTEAITETISLRQSTEDDIELMFSLQHLDGKKLNPKDSDQIKKLQDYQEVFEPSAVQVIQYNDRPVGRLRVVNDNKSIYLGGIQLLPDHRGKGIGTDVLYTLIKKSNTQQIPLTLHVWHNNPRALRLYEDLGFRIVEEDTEKKLMQYNK